MSSEIDPQFEYLIIVACISVCMLCVNKTVIIQPVRQLTSQPVSQPANQPAGQPGS